MSDDIDKRKAKFQRWEHLVNQYAQSRSLGLLLFVVLIVISTILVVLLMELVFWKPAGWLLGIVMLMMAGMAIGGFWLVVKVLPRYEWHLYRKEGQVELERKKVSIWASVAYVVAFLGPVSLNAAGIMPTRWTLTLALVSLGVFVLYASGKERNKPLGVVFCIVLLLEAAVTAAGAPTPFSGKGWLYCCFAALMIYIAGASLITALVVHTYNRWILRKIKQSRPFGECESNKSDS